MRKGPLTTNWNICLYLYYIELNLYKFLIFLSNDFLNCIILVPG